jgi:tubulin epsilon
MVTQPQWNPDGWKTGLCSVPCASGGPSLLALSNHSCVTTTLERLGERFAKLRRRRAHMHHYTEYMDVDEFRQAGDWMDELIRSYKNIK